MTNHQTRRVEAIPVTQPPEFGIPETPYRAYNSGDEIAGRYHVISRLAGGMADVYIALLGTHLYALKTPKQHHVMHSPLGMQEFYAEVNNWVNLGEHPNIVQCFRLEILDGHPFLVLEPVIDQRRDRADLRHYLDQQGAQGPWLDLRIALDLAIDICHGLAHAHEQGVIHCDLKPGNILITKDRRAKITDFGISKSISGVSTSSAGGTPPYMAPEQWYNEPVDVRWDIYALGCLLYEMLVGRPPFGSGITDSTSLRESHERATPPDLPTSYPDALNRILKKCLEKLPNKRFASVTELLQALSKLRQLLNDDTTPEYESPQESEEYGEWNDYQRFEDRGQLLFSLGRYEEALVSQNQAIKLMVDNEIRKFRVHMHGKPSENEAFLYNNRGVTLLVLERYHEALNDFNQAIEINPRLVTAYCNRAKVYSALHAYDQALADYTTAIRLDPESSHAHNARGHLYASLYQYDEAIGDFSRAIQFDPKDPSAYRNRSSIYLDLGRLDEALVDSERASDLDTESTFHQEAAWSSRKENPGQYHIMGIVQARNGMLDEAVSNFSRAIELDPLRSDAYHGRGDAYREMAEYDYAIEDYTQALETIHADAYLRTMILRDRGLAYEYAEQYELALNDLQEAVRLGNSDAIDDARRLLAKLFKLGLETLPEIHSANQMREAIERFPFLGRPEFAAQIEVRLGWLRQVWISQESYTTTDTRDEAQEPATPLPESQPIGYVGQIENEILQRHQDAINDDPSNSDNYRTIGLILGKRGMLREALGFLEKAIQLGDDDEELYELALRIQNQIYFEAFSETDSQEAMQRVIDEFPYLIEQAFVDYVERAIVTETPFALREYFIERLRWLQDLAQKQGDDQFTGSVGSVTRNTMIDRNEYTAEYYRDAGKSLLDLDLSEEAISCFDKAIQLDKGFSAAYIDRGVTLATLGRDEEAIADFSQVIQMEPSDAAAYFNRGWVYMHLDRYQDALTDYTDSIRLDPDIALAYVRRGYCHFMMDDNDAALSDFGHALRLDPDNARACIGIGTVFRHAGLFQPAIEYFTMAFERGLAEAQVLADETHGEIAETAFSAFLEAESYADLRQTLFQLPSMPDLDLVATVKRMISSEVDPERQAYYEQRVDWLGMIAAERTRLLDQSQQLEVTRFPLITIYTIPDCEFCAQLKEYLRSRGHSYQERDLEYGPIEWLTEMLHISNNFMATPVTHIRLGHDNSVVLKGFVEEEIDGLLI